MDIMNKAYKLKFSLLRINYFLYDEIKDLYKNLTNAYYDIIVRRSCF